MSAKHLLAFAAVTTILAGCGAHPQMATVQRPASLASTLSTSKNKNDADHAQMNKIVAGVLGTVWADLAASTDANHDGAVSRDEYAKNHSQDAAWLFQATFDENRDGVITQAEFDKAMATDAPVEAYHEFTEKNMEKAIEPYMADKKFDAQELRSYLTKDLGLTGDWPQIFKMMDKLDLNNDGKILSGPGEGSAFLLTFAQAQLQKALSMPVTPIQL